jgi:hypothetical protein
MFHPTINRNGRNRKIDSTIGWNTGYQMQSECCGVHDGSPYKQVNIMRHYENTASDRGSRIYGFNPEYGAPCLPTVECLREMMDEEDLWPINKKVWDYSDGNGFHLMSTLYADMVNEYGESDNIDDFAKKGQLVGAFNYKSIWEVWNYNKLNYGDRYTSVSCSGITIHQFVRSVHVCGIGLWSRQLAFMLLRMLVSPCTRSSIFLRIPFRW